ncbi:MAG TPA: hypothetical protein VF911_12160 [Thermoanaerobaculia bacterium]|jgi:lauroyl/myristoyl acyltransferase
MIAEAIRNALGFLASLPFRLVPRRLRFDAVMRFGFAIAPFAGPRLVGRFENVVGGSIDETLRVLFRALLRTGIRYEPRIEADVDEELLPALRAGGIIGVTAHFPLNAFFLRWLHDQGHGVITAVRDMPGRSNIWGTGTPIDLIQPTRHVMVQMRKKLSEGCPLLLAIDRAKPHTRAIAVETRFGATAVATPMFTLAEKMGVPMFFYAVRVTESRAVRLTVRRIPYDPNAFAEQFRRHSELMLP